MRQLNLIAGLVLSILMECRLGVAESRPSTASPQKSSPDPKRRALLVGFEHYRQSKGFAQLPEAANDVAAMLGVLQTLHYEQSNIKVISDTSAGDLGKFTAIAPNAGYLPWTSLGAILSELDSLVSSAGRGDTLFVYFSGHGAAFGDQRFLALPDSNARQSPTMLSVPTVIEKLRTGVPLVNRVLAVDACAKRESSQDPGGPSTPADVHGVDLLFSSEVGENSYSAPQYRQGVFSYFLVQALKGLDANLWADGRLTVNELGDYLEVQVPDYGQHSGGDGSPRQAIHDPYTANGQPHVQHPKRVIVNSFVVGERAVHGTR